MRICEDCMREQFETEQDRSGSFPGLTVVGATLGGIAAAFTGSLILFPVALFAGFCGDLLSCDVCGRSFDPDEMYRVMERRTDDDAEIKFVPVRPPHRHEDQPDDGENTHYAFDENTNTLVPVGFETGPGDENADAGFDWSVPPASDFAEAGTSGPDASAPGAPPSGGPDAGGSQSATGSSGSAPGGGTGGGQ